MNWWQALILGLVEGITEYLPVSSTGHLLVAQRMLGIHQSEAADAFAICIQAGAIVAVLGLYWKHVWQMMLGLVGKSEQGRRLLINLVVAFLPAVVIGLFLEKPIKTYLFGGEKWGLWPIVAAWVVGGGAILYLASKQRQAAAKGAPSGFSLEELTVRAALIIGLTQCLAMWPGTSRSLVTILGGLLIGMRMSSAVEFSFLLGVLTLGAATSYDGLKHGKEMMAVFGPGEIALGFLAAWVSAVLAVKWMVAYLNRRGLEIFGWYRIALGIVVAGLIIGGFFR